MKINYTFFRKDKSFWKKIEASISANVVEREVSIDGLEEKVIDAIMDRLKRQLSDNFSYELFEQLMKNDAFMQKLLNACLENVLLKEVVHKAIETSAQETIKRMLGVQR